LAAANNAFGFKGFKVRGRLQETANKLEREGRCGCRSGLSPAFMQNLLMLPHRKMLFLLLYGFYLFYEESLIFGTKFKANK
jgi:hypothetical protein